MNRIEQRFAELKERNEAAFIAYVMAGDPSLARTKELLLALEEAGVDVIECGAPFSDPLGDGVVIQEAAQRALKNRVSLRNVLETIAEVREQSDVPILLFTYYNPALAYGIEKLADDCQNAGVDGILCVDLPPDDAEEYKKHFDSRGIATVFLAAPTSTPERMKRIADASTGFVYYISRTGVTGERASVEGTVGAMVGRIKAVTDKPVAVGFGISTPEHAAEVAGSADGVVVGSAIVRLIGSIGDVDELADKVKVFTKELVTGAKSVASKR